MQRQQFEDTVYCTWNYRVTLPPILRDRLGDLDQLLRDLISSAQSQVLLVAPYLSPAGINAIKDSLTIAAERGAFIRIVTENLDANGGLNRKAIAALIDGESGARIRARLRVLTAAGAVPELIHAKVVVADSRRGYIGSANLSWRAMQSNLEIGVALSPHQATTVEQLIDFYESVGHVTEA